MAGAFPPNMFANAQTTLNVLVSLEDAFIAAYLVGVRQFSHDSLRVTAARIMGIESDHRTLARVVAPGVAAQDGGPIETVTGISGRRRERRPAQQQRLRAHTRLDKDQPGRHGLTTIRKRGRSRASRLRHLEAIPVQPIHADPPLTTGGVPLLHRLIANPAGGDIRRCGGVVVASEPRPAKTRARLSGSYRVTLARGC